MKLKKEYDNFFIANTYRMHIEFTVIVTFHNYDQEIMTLIDGEFDEKINHIQMIEYIISKIDDEKKYDVFKIDAAHIRNDDEDIFHLFDGVNGNGNYFNVHGRWFFGSGCKLPNEFIHLIG